MKKGQAKFIIILLVIIGILLFVVVLKPKLTGNVIKEETSEVIEPQGTILNPINSNSNYVGSAQISPPFYINAWNIRTTGIKIELKNTGEEPLKITKVSVSNCGEVSTTSEKNVFSIPCLLSKGSQFTGDITIEYSKIGSSIKLSSTGIISDKII